MKQKTHFFASMPHFQHLNHLETEPGPKLKISAHLIEGFFFFLGAYKPNEGLWTSENLASAFSLHRISLRNLGPVSVLSRSLSPSLWNGENTTYFTRHFESQM